MTIYDFSVYARRRDERKAAQAVAEAVADLSQPGSVVQLKSKVNDWFTQHREMRRVAS